MDWFSSILQIEYQMSTEGYLKRVTVFFSENFISNIILRIFKK